MRSLPFGRVNCQGKKQQVIHNMLVFSSHKISNSNYGSAYNCAICHQSFVNPSNLVKHVEFIHEPELSPEKSRDGVKPEETDPIDKENVDPGK